MAIDSQMGEMPYTSWDVMPIGSWHTFDYGIIKTANCQFFKNLDRRGGKISGTPPGIAILQLG
jgi:hypothetical protein